LNKIYLGPPSLLWNPSEKESSKKFKRSANYQNIYKNISTKMPTNLKSLKFLK
jgi:hypothetical protein